MSKIGQIASDVVLQASVVAKSAEEFAKEDVAKIEEVFDRRRQGLLAKRNEIMHEIERIDRWRQEGKDEADIAERTQLAFYALTTLVSGLTLAACSKPVADFGYASIVWEQDGTTHSLTAERDTDRSIDNYPLYRWHVKS